MNRTIVCLTLKRSIKRSCLDVSRLRATTLTSKHVLLPVITHECWLSVCAQLQGAVHEATMSPCRATRHLNAATAVGSQAVSTRCGIAQPPSQACPVHSTCWNSYPFFFLFATCAIVCMSTKQEKNIMYRVHDRRRRRSQERQQPAWIALNTYVQMLALRRTSFLGEPPAVPSGSGTNTSARPRRRGTGATEATRLCR